MKLTQQDIERIYGIANNLMAELEEHGVSNALLCVSFESEDTGWDQEFFVTGDPMASKGLAAQFLEEEDDGGVMMMIGGPGGE